MKTILLQINFILVAIANLLLTLSPHSIIRVIILRALRFNIGRKVSIQRGVKISSLLGKISIGDGSIIGVNVLMDNRRGIFIGKNVNISRDCIILSLGHNIWDKDFPTKGKSVVIQDSAWLFMGVAVMPGTNIGENTVVYSYSVISGKLFDHGHYQGNPAKCIRIGTVCRTPQDSYRYWFSF